MTMNKYNMNTKKLLSFLLLMLVFIPSVSAESHDYRLKVEDFTSLKLNNGINVEYYCSADSAGCAYFTCSPELASQFIFTNNKSTLTIQLADSIDPSIDMPTIRVYSTMLEKVENGSDSTIRIMSHENVKNFKARVIGNGMIVLNDLKANSVDFSVVTGHGHIVCSSGQAIKAKLSNVGTGTIQAGGLVASQIKVFMSGTGSIDCNATESLTIYGMGSGSVYYSGNPAKVTNRSVGIKAYPIDK